MAGCCCLFILTLVCLTLPGAYAFKPNIKIGLNLGTSSGKQDDSLHYCIDPKEQLLKNLYVDYFHSLGPCVTPKGGKVYTFRNTDYGSADDAYTRSALCAKLPRICQLMGRQGARGILEVGQQVMESFSHNMRGLVHLLTGRSSPAAADSHTSPLSPDSRFFATHQKPEAIVSPGGCGYGGCPEYGLSVCESISDLVFPMVGKSALTNTTVTIVQSFPDLVQPVFFRKCRTHQAQVIHGYCIQEYLPISFYVSPPYPGAVLAQDFIMVESGCHVKADVTHHKWKTQARDITHLDNSTNKIYGNVERMRESDRRLF